MTDQFGELLSKYVNNLTGIRKELDRKVLSTRSLSKLFKDGDKILSISLDTLMLFLKNDNPVFYIRYIKARKIHAAGIRHNLSEDRNDLNKAA